MDPAALKKAFRFAAWSSLVLVRSLFSPAMRFLWLIVMGTTSLAGRYAPHHTTPAFLRIYDIRRKRTDGMGCDWNHLDLRVCRHGRPISIVGEQRSVAHDLNGNDQGMSCLFMGSLNLGANADEYRISSREAAGDTRLLRSVPKLELRRATNTCNTIELYKYEHGYEQSRIRQDTTAIFMTKRDGPRM